MISRKIWVTEKSWNFHTISWHPSHSWICILIQDSFLQQSLPKRMPSPSPSNGSTTSSTSLVSEGRKSTTSAGNNAQGGKKFGKLLISRNFCHFWKILLITHFHVKKKTRYTPNYNWRWPNWNWTQKIWNIKTWVKFHRNFCWIWKFWRYY